MIESFAMETTTKSLSVENNTTKCNSIDDQKQSLVTCALSDESDDSYCVGSGDEDSDSDDDNSHSDDDESSVGSYDLATITENKNLSAKPTQEEKRSGLFLSLAMVEQLRLSTSEGNLNSVIQDESVQKMLPRVGSTGNIKDAKLHGVGKAVIFAVQTHSSTESNQNDGTTVTVPKPKEVLFNILDRAATGGTNIVPPIISHEEIADTFVTGTSVGYSCDLVTAVKKGDVDYLRTLYQQRHQPNFQYCNRFGESIVHASARQCQFRILQTLVNEMNVSLRVRCDTGRTPLHDACWTARPNFPMITFLIEQCPEFLFVRDKKGFIPFEYAPKDSHKQWDSYLINNADHITSRIQTHYQNAK